MKRSKVAKYLNDIGLDAGYDVMSGVGVYLWEMDRKLADSACLREMMPSYLGVGSSLQYEHPVIVIDAGGTNLRIAVATLHKAKAATISDYSCRPLPGSAETVSKEYFFTCLAECLQNVIEKSDNISFCFSYPLIMECCNEGTLLQLAKQVSIADIIGANISEHLRSALGKQGLDSRKKITLLNDSTAALLSALSGPDRNIYSGYIGFILGTGINLAYVESSAKIAKVRQPCALETMVVNMEASRFAMFPQGKIDTLMDGSTTDPGDYVFEKMVSGKYLGKLAQVLLTDACDCGILPLAVKDSLACEQPLTTPDVGEFLCDLHKQSRLSVLLARHGEETAVVACQLLDVLVERAAKYCAIALCSVLTKSSSNADPFHPVCIVAEGGTYWNFPAIRERISYHLMTFARLNENIHYRIVAVENSALSGAAVAALSQ